MQLTNKLRWLVRKNQVTAEEVLTYSTSQGVSTREALAQLENSKPPVLQQWWEAEGGEPGSGEWRNVPVVYEPIP